MNDEQCKRAGTLFGALLLRDETQNGLVIDFLKPEWPTEAAPLNFALRIFWGVSEFYFRLKFLANITVISDAQYGIILDSFLKPMEPTGLDGPVFSILLQGTERARAAVRSTGEETQYRDEAQATLLWFLLEIVHGIKNPFPWISGMPTSKIAAALRAEKPTAVIPTARQYWLNASTYMEMFSVGAAAHVWESAVSGRLNDDIATL